MTRRRLFTATQSSRMSDITTNSEGTSWCDMPGRSNSRLLVKRRRGGRWQWPERSRKWPGRARGSAGRRAAEESGESFPFITGKGNKILQGDWDVNYLRALGL